MNLRILQINKGTSNFGKHIDSRKILIKEDKADLIIIPETHFKRNEEHLNIHFPGFNIEIHFMPGAEIGQNFNNNK